MALVTSRAIVLRNYRLGETSKVVVCYTRDYGKVRLVAKGARKGGGRFGAALEPLMVSGVVFYLKEGRDLSLVSQASIERVFPELRRDVVRMAFGGAVLELVDRLLMDHEPDPALYNVVEEALARTAEMPLPTLDVVLWKFELDIAYRLGYQPELTRCVSCGATDATWAGFSPEFGGLVCRRCDAGTEAPGTLPVGPEAAVLAALTESDVAELMASTGGARTDREPVCEAAGRSAPLAVAGQTLTPAVRDDITFALGAFLERHAGRSMKLKSLDFLAQIRRIEEPMATRDGTGRTDG